MRAFRGAAATVLVAAPAFSEQPKPAAPPPVEVTVQGARSEAQELQESAEAVTVIGTQRAARETADLGEVLARAQGVGVRREGGLGSQATISMNGMQGDQVRLFLDGVPLHLAGYPLGITTVPVGLIERIEIYRGVVPIRFGADALAGAINLATDRNYATHAGASYQVGSYGTVRMTANGRYRHEPTGLVFGATSFFDSARNDFWMDDRELPTPTGGTIVRSVRRFHDAYRAVGGTLEGGIVERPWAKSLLFSSFFSTYHKELQHNAVMSMPYGEPTYGETTYGVSARYSVEPDPAVELQVLAHYTYRRVDFRDLSDHQYKWTGEPGIPVGRAGARGEIRARAMDQSVYEDTWYGRLGASWALSPEHTLRASMTPELALRVGDDHVVGRVDKLGLHDSFFQLVGGVEYQLDLFGERLSNIAFAKGYHLHATHEDLPEFVVSPELLHMKTSVQSWGAGDAFRMRITPWLLGKVSYEYATRLPRPDEIFGNGVLVESNAELKPEKSHNLNVGPRLTVERTRYGDLTVDVNGFLRMIEDQIVLLAGKQFIPHANIADVRGLGVEGAASYVSPRRYLMLEGSLSWVDLRNVSEEGPFAPMNGMRIPSRPYAFASWGARSRFARQPFALEPFYYGRYVHGFNRGWAIGNPEYKITLPSQVSHDLGVTYAVRRPAGSFTSTFEIDNLTDAKLYDVFGVQRPGRSVNLKLTAHW